MLHFRSFTQYSLYLNILFLPFMIRWLMLLFNKKKFGLIITFVLLIEMSFYYSLLCVIMSQSSTINTMSVLGITLIASTAFCKNNRMADEWFFLLKLPGHSCLRKRARGCTKKKRESDCLQPESLILDETREIVPVERNGGWRRACCCAEPGGLSKETERGWERTAERLQW